MAVFDENMMISATILLFVINGLFLFTVLTIPGSEAGGPLNLGIGQDDIDDMNNLYNNTLTDTNILGGPSVLSDDVSASSTTKTFITIFQSWLFGALNAITGTISLIGKILSMFGYMFFGYVFWIDLFFPPAISGIAVLGNMFKIILFIINIMGIFALVFRIFYAGTGVRG